MKNPLKTEIQIESEFSISQLNTEPALKKHPTKLFQLIFKTVFIQN